MLIGTHWRTRITPNIERFPAHRENHWDRSIDSLARNFLTID